MKRLCSYFAAISLCSAATIIQAQSGGGAGGAGGAAGGAGTQAGSAQVGGSAPGIGQRGGIASPGVGGVANEQGAIARGAQQVPGVAPAAQLPGQSGSAQIGGNAPGAGRRGGIASPGLGGIANEQGAIATGGQTPTTVQGQNPLGGAQQPVSFNALPVAVQNALRSRLGAVSPTAIGQQMTPNGPVYTVTTQQNGVPAQLRFSATGTPLPAVSVAAQPGVVATVPGAAGLGNAEAGLPVTSLPAQVQASIRSQLGNTQIQAVSQDQSATGPLYRVTALQNGLPVEFQFSANGALLARNPLPAGSATSAIAPGAVVGTLPGTLVVLDDLPETIRDTIQERVGENTITQLRQQQTANGNIYWVAYDDNGRPIRMRVDEEGNIRTNIPATAQAEEQENRLTLEELPEPVHAALENQAPLADIESITRTQRPSGEVYRVSFRDAADDSFTVLEIDADGEIVRDSREVPVVIVGEQTASSKAAEEEPTGQRYERLPAAVQTAIKAYAAEGQIRNINLTTHDNDTVFSVVFFRDGRRDRMLVTKDGTLIRIEEDVSPALAVTPSQPAELAIGDLPRSVRDTIRRQTDQVMVDEIETTTVGNQTAYKVSYRTNNTPVELLVGTDGKVILPVGDIDGAAAPRTAPVAVREDTPVRTVDVSSVTGEEELEPALGVAASRETGAESQSSTTSEPANAASTVNLADVPLPVQTTAKKLAGGAIIESIAPKLEDGQVVYKITFSEEGRERVVTVDKSGQAQKQAKPAAK